MSADYAAVAERMSSRLDEIVDSTIERLWGNPALDEWTRPETRGGAREIARASIAREVAALESRELPTSCPDEDLAAARSAVAFGAPVTVVLQCYRAGHAALWETWVELVEEVATDEAATRRALLETGAAFMFDYVDRCSAWVEGEHTRERERLLRGREQRRMHLVQSILAGDETEGLEELGYELGQVHVGVIGWGPDAEPSVRRLADDLAVSSLTLSVDGETCWGWLGTGSELSQAQDRRIGNQPLPDGTRLAVGEPAAGIAGFRGSHAEAREAERVARYRGARVTRHEDVALEALSLHDDARARAFARRELGDLTAPGGRARILRDTLEAYLASDHSAVAAAATLSVHERTVGNRLRAIERRLGGPISDRPAELAIALRLHRLLDRG